MSEKPRRSTRRGVTLLKLALGALVVAYVVWSRRVDFGKLGEAFRNEAGWIVAGFAILLMVPVTGWTRWLVIVRAQGIAIGAYESLRIHLIGIFFNAFLLGSMGGDVLRAYYVATGAGSERKAASVTTVLLDRVFGALGFIVVIACGLAVSWRTLPTTTEFRWILLIVGVMAAGWITIIVIVLVPQLRALRRRWFGKLSGRPTFAGRVAKVLDDADEAAQEARRHPRASLLCVALAATGHLTMAVAFYCFARALGVADVPFRRYAVLAPIVVLGAAVPLPGGALGVGELLGSIVFSLGAEAAKWVGGTAVLLWRIGLFVPGPVGFVYFVLHRDEVRRAREAGEAREATLRAEGAPGEGGPGTGSI